MHNSNITLRPPDSHNFCLWAVKKASGCTPARDSRIAYFTSWEDLGTAEDRNDSERQV